MDLIFEEEKGHRNLFVLYNLSKFGLLFHPKIALRQILRAYILALFGRFY